MSDHSIYEEDYEHKEPPTEFQMQIQPINITFQLSPENGEIIKDLIRDLYASSFPNYCLRVGLRPPNFYNAVNGERPCTLEFLNKLLSGINYTAELLHPVLVIRDTATGRIVNAADLVLPENGLQSSEGEVNQDTQESSLLEKHLDRLKTKPDTLLSEQQEKSSTPPLDSSPTNSNTSSQMPWDVDL